MAIERHNVENHLINDFQRIHFIWQTCECAMANVKYLPNFGVRLKNIRMLNVKTTTIGTSRRQFENQVIHLFELIWYRWNIFLPLLKPFHSYCTWRKINMHNFRCWSNIFIWSSYLLRANVGQPWDALWFWHDL